MSIKFMDATAIS